MRSKLECLFLMVIEPFLVWLSQDLGSSGCLYKFGGIKSCWTYYNRKERIATIYWTPITFLCFSSIIYNNHSSPVRKVVECLFTGGFYKEERYPRSQGSGDRMWTYLCLTPQAVFVSLSYGVFLMKTKWGDRRIRKIVMSRAD